MHPRSWRRVILVVGSGVLVVWLATVVWLLVGARQEMAAGAADLRQVRRRASVTALVEPAGQRELEAAAAHFDAAEGKVDSILLAPLRVVPGLSRHLGAAQRVVDASQEGTDIADDALTSITELADRPQGSGVQRVETVRELAAVAGRARGELERLDPGSPDSLVGPLSDAVAELGEQRADAAAAAGQLEAASEAIAGVIDGPDPYLLLGANNAEMRNGSGMALSATEVSFDQGTMTIGDVQPTADLLAEPASVPAAGDLAANWPWIDVGRDLRNVGLTADFPQSAATAVDTWAGVPGGGPVAGVILIDVDGIRSLLRVVGPVEVAGIRYTPDTVRGELLRNQYTQFDGDRSGRRDQLGDVTRAIFERLESGEWKLQDLATELADAVQGRHLLVWSTDEAAADAWRSVGADGHLTDQSLSVGLLSRSATKLDSWIDAAVDVSSEAAGDGKRMLTVTYDLTSRAPASGPAYVVGPNVDGLAAGDHTGLVVVNLPAGATDVQMTGAEPFLQGGDGPTVVVGGNVSIPRGSDATVTVTALLPAQVDRLTIEPSARIEPTTWRVNGRDFRRDRRRTVQLAS